MAASVTTAPALEFGQPKPLFSDPNLGRSPTYSFSTYDVWPDGERFVLAEAVEPTGESVAQSQIHIVENWFSQFQD